MEHLNWQAIFDLAKQNLVKPKLAGSGKKGCSKKVKGGVLLKYRTPFSDTQYNSKAAAANAIRKEFEKNYPQILATEYEDLIKELVNDGEFVSVARKQPPITKEDLMKNLNKYLRDNAPEKVKEEKKDDDLEKKEEEKKITHPVEENVKQDEENIEYQMKKSKQPKLPNIGDLVKLMQKSSGEPSMETQAPLQEIAQVAVAKIKRQSKGKANAADKANIGAKMSALRASKLNPAKLPKVVLSKSKVPKKAKGMLIQGTVAKGRGRLPKLLIS